MKGYHDEISEAAKACMESLGPDHYFNKTIAGPLLDIVDNGVLVKIDDKARALGSGMKPYFDSGKGIDDEELIPEARKVFESACSMIYTMARINEKRLMRNGNGTV